jgi:hypothetical protein
MSSLPCLVLNSPNKMFMTFREFKEYMFQLLVEAAFHIANSILCLDINIQ